MKEALTIIIVCVVAALLFGFASTTLFAVWIVAGAGLLLFVYLIYRMVAGVRLAAAARNSQLALYREMGFTVHEGDLAHCDLPAVQKQEDRVLIEGSSVSDLKSGDGMEFRFQLKSGFPHHERFKLYYNCGFRYTNHSDAFKECEVHDLPPLLECQAVEGAVIYALLDHTTRNRLWTLHTLTDRFYCTQDTCEASLTFEAIGSKDQFTLFLETGCSLLNSVPAAAPRLELLAQIALKDPDPFYRGKAIDCLGEIHGRTQSGDERQRVREVLKQALEDQSLPNRITAAGWMGEAGVDHIEQLTHATEPAESAAVEAAVHSLIAITGRAHLHKPVDWKRLQLLLQLYFLTSSRKIKQKILDHTSKAFPGHPSRLAPFLKGEDRALGMVVVQALGECGSLDAVEPLLELAQSSRSRRIDQAVNQAIAAIQSRHGKGDGGWLTVAETAEEAGALSMDKRAGSGGGLSRATQPGKGKQ